MKLTTLLNSALVATMLMFAARLARANAADGRLDVYFIDTEGGASTLVVTPAGESLLVDTGNPGERDPNRIVTAVKDAGLSRIDYLVITHYHVDHFGGAPTLATLLPIGTLYDNADQNASTEKPSKAYLDMKVDKRIMINPGDIIPLKQAATGSKLTVQCLAARKKFIDTPADAKANPFAASATTKPADTSDNASSIVQLVSFGDFRFYDGGDLTWNIEAQLVSPSNRVGTVDVYQVTHHGLDLSNNPILVKALEPTVAIINNGVTKGCEPHTFATLKDTPSIKDIWQLHRNLRPDGGTNNTTRDLIANLNRDCTGEFIKLSVAPDGASYTVSIPSTKVSRTYQTVKH
jgi:beta-lactamase superfamily II metal-dependent hydrolase